MRKENLIAKRTVSRIFLLVLLIFATSISFAPITRSPVTEWDVVLTASLDIYNDVSEFGVRNDATDGFNTAYDALDPPEPPGSGVISYFWYPDNPSSPRESQIRQWYVDDQLGCKPDSSHSFRIRHLPSMSWPINNRHAFGH